MQTKLLDCIDAENALNSHSSQYYMLSFCRVGIVISSLQSIGKSVYLGIFKLSKEKFYGNLFTERMKEEIYVCKKCYQGKGEKRKQ